MGPCWWWSRARLSLHSGLMKYRAVLRSMSGNLIKQAGTTSLLPNSSVLGAAHPENILVFFGDFECQPCRRLLRRISPTVSASNKLQLVYRNFPLPNRKFADVLARLGRIAEERHRFWEFVDICESRQFGSSEECFGAARLVGIPEKVARARIADNADVSSVSLRAELDLGRRLEVNATPTVVLLAKGRNPSFVPISQVEALVARLR